MRWIAGLLIGGLAGCAATASVDDGLVRLDMVSSGGTTTFTLEPAAGVRINALLLPTIELATGARIVLDAASRTEGDAYFRDPPSARVSGGVPAGSLRAGVCPAGVSACQVVVLALPGPTAP